MLETHPGTDQFLRVDAGSGLARMGPSKTDPADTEQDEEAGTDEPPAWTVQPD